MRVLTNRPELLVIEEKPWFLGLLLAVFVLGLAAAALGAAFEGSWGMAAALAASAAAVAALAAWVIERVWLVLDRREGTVELRRRGLRGFRRESFPLGRLQAVQVQSDFSDGDRTWRLALRLTGAPAPLPMTRYYQGGRGAETCAEAARAWLAAPADRAGQTDADPATAHPPP